jgi:hypothetical protein
MQRASHLDLFHSQVCLQVIMKLKEMKKADASFWAISSVLAIGPFITVAIRLGMKEWKNC